MLQLQHEVEFPEESFIAVTDYRYTAFNSGGVALAPEKYHW